jgi:ATP-binding cassette subfamily B protein
VVLDDALSAVDSETESRILHELRSALVGKTVIVVSHRAAAVREADEIIVLDAGRIVERGSYASLLGAGGRFAELVRHQLLEAELEIMVSGKGETGAGPEGRV